MSGGDRRVTEDEAVALLDVRPAAAVAFTNSKGIPFDDDGNHVDRRKLEPWVHSTAGATSAAGAVQTIRSRPGWRYAHHWMHGWTVVSDRGEGWFAAQAREHTPAEAAAAPSVKEAGRLTEAVREHLLLGDDDAAIEALRQAQTRLAEAVAALTGGAE